MTLSSRARRRLIATCIAGAAVACAPRAPGAGTEPSTPGEAVAELLAADRRFAAGAAGTDVITALTPMLDTGAMMPVSAEQRLARGSADVLGVLRLNPDNARSRIEWSPIRGGISADGQHGFTYGYTTLTRPDGPRVPGKYLSYWIRRAEGWRVAAYRRAPRPEGAVLLAMRAPALPSRMVAPVSDTAVRARLLEELKETERAFSRDAQPMGLGPAFVRYAAPDAMNMGGPQDAEFLFGPEAIGAGVGAGSAPGTTITWEPTDALVASSGDLGITLGIITVVSAPGTDTPSATRRFPYFTVWRRAGPGAPWRFVAE